MTTAAESARTVSRPVSRAVRMRRSPIGRFVWKLPFWILIALIFIYALFPFYWALRSAFTPEAQLFDTPIQYFPHHPTLQNFRDVLDSDFFRRALLKLSGEALLGERPYGIDPQAAERCARDIAAVRAAGTEICVVVGGGNIFRGLSAAAKGMDRVKADYIGMMATVMNGVALENAFATIGTTVNIFPAIH